MATLPTCCRWLVGFACHYGMPRCLALIVARGDEEGGCHSYSGSQRYLLYVLPCGSVLDRGRRHRCRRHHYQRAIKVPELFALFTPALIIWFVGRLCSWVLVPPVRSTPSQQPPFAASSQQPRTEEPLILRPESARRLIVVAIGWVLLAEAAPAAVGFFRGFATGFVRGLTKGASQLV